MNVLITGANRGIGLSFVKHYLAQGANVWACYRTDKQALEEIETEQLNLLQWDITQPRPNSGEFPENLDLLINNAGIYGPAKQQGQTLESVSAETMLEVLVVGFGIMLLPREKDGTAQQLSALSMSSRGKIIMPHKSDLSGAVKFDAISKHRRL